MQVTFDADKLAEFASGHSGKNILITKNEHGIKATVVPKPGVSATSDEGDGGELDGCPYPPGCTG